MIPLAPSGWPRRSLAGAASLGLLLASAVALAVAPPATHPLSSAPSAEVAPGLAPPVPLTLEAAVAGSAFDPFGTIGLFEGAIYRKDGTINDWGLFAEWAHANRVRVTPGFNCSGHVLAASRILLEQAIPLDAARFDRLGDSGLGAPRGQDWDFGWDVVMNLALMAADPADLTYFDARGKARPLSGVLGDATAEVLRGFSVWDRRAWGEVIGAIADDTFYLASFSRVGFTQRGTKILHHHTVLILGHGDEVWAQGASPQNPLGPRVQSLMISDPSELDTLLSQFSRYKSEQVLIVGLPLALSRLDLQP